MYVYTCIYSFVQVNFPFYVVLVAVLSIFFNVYRV
jgi:hypothetical protein